MANTGDYGDCRLMASIRAGSLVQFELPPWAKPQQQQLFPGFVPPPSQFIAPLAEGENPHSFERLHMYECGARAQRPEIYCELDRDVRTSLEAAMQKHAPVGLGAAVAAAIKERERPRELQRTELLFTEVRP